MNVPIIKAPYCSAYMLYLLWRTFANHEKLEWGEKIFEEKSASHKAII